jgi:hypothetical protein
VAGTIDLLPTAVTLAGGRIPAQPIIDGRDLSPLLFGTSKESPREAHYYFAGYNLQAVRQGPWKLAIAPQPEGMGRTGPKEGTDGKPRLYNLEAEIGERTSVADQHPDIVAKLQALAAKMNADIGGTEPAARRPAGEGANPSTLYPTEASAPKQDTRPVKTNPGSLKNLKPGDTLPGDDAPQVADRPFTIRCSVETKQTDAIILAHGGVSAGYALYIKGGRIVFAVRTGGDDALREITAPAALASPTLITAALDANGKMTLTVNQNAPVTGQALRLLPRQPAENFCLGHDDAKPVARYSAKEAFQGTIKDLTITTP